MIIVIVIKIHLMIVSEVRMAASKVVAILGKMTTMMMMMMMMMIELRDVWPAGSS